jgi:hypothetical protein
MRSFILILMDAEDPDHCPKRWAPQLLQWAKEAWADADIGCVLANPMFETWFAAAAQSLAGVNGLPEDLQTPADPEGNRLGKTWLKRQLRTKKLNRGYSETVDQARFVDKIDLEECHRNSRSFRHLCKELQLRCPPGPTTGSGGTKDQNPPENAPAQPDQSPPPEDAGS